MIIIGGSSARYYRCGDFHKRRTCQVSRALRQDLVSDAILGLMRRQVLQPQAVSYLAEMLRRKAESTQEETTRDSRSTESELAAAQKRITRLVDSIASGVLTGAALGPVQRRLEEEEVARKAMEARLQHLHQNLGVVRRAPTAADLTKQAEELIENLVQLLRDDAIGAREQIRRFIPGGRIEMTPNEDGSWTANLLLYPPILIGPTKTNGPGGGSEAVYSSSCAGAICSLEHAVRLEFRVVLCR